MYGQLYESKKKVGEMKLQNKNKLKKTLKGFKIDSNTL